MFQRAFQQLKTLGLKMENDGRAFMQRGDAVQWLTANKEALDQALYSFDDDIGSNTLEVYVSRLRKKLGKQRIETLRGLGYRLVEETKE